MLVGNRCVEKYFVYDQMKLLQSNKITTTKIKNILDFFLAYPLIYCSQPKLF